jgi:ribonuclease Y
VKRHLAQKEKKIGEKEKAADDKLANLSKLEEDLKQRIDNQIHVLEEVAHLSQEDAKKELMEAVEKKSPKRRSPSICMMQQEEAETKASDNAKNVIALAIQRYAQDETIERTVSTVTLTSEEMKGRIIGREGRNIKAIEQATGVDLIIDDTPDVITVSCFDPIRREIARQSLEILMKDGRIQPGRIEEVVEKVTKELDDAIMKIGNDTIFQLGIGKMNRELVKLVGRLRFRYSYGQNGLEHSVEVANFAGMMAAELGLNQALLSVQVFCMILARQLTSNRKEAMWNLVPSMPRNMVKARSSSMQSNPITAILSQQILSPTWSLQLIH